VHSQNPPNLNDAKTGQAMATILFLLVAPVFHFFVQFLRSYRTSGQYYEGNIFLISLYFDNLANTLKSKQNENNIKFLP
jgi:hypothetical protein